MQPSPNGSQIPLSDATCGVIAKAMRAQDISVEELARLSKLPVSVIHQALDEHAELPTKDELRAIASACGLSPFALAELSNYAPSAAPPRELVQIVSPFYHVGSNSYIIRHPNTKNVTLFDSGTDASLIHDFLKKENLTLSAIYITHAHHDHISGLDTFGNTPIFFPEDLAHGQERQLCDSIALTAVDSSGHFSPSRAYIIHGLETPICICGDIIFPGSMGKTSSPEKHQESLENAKNHIMTLPPHTLLCSGHGPISTIGQESERNPFLAPYFTKN